MKSYKLPPAFWHDHRSRDLPEQGTVELLRDAQRSVTVAMDAAAYDDLLSDARHYSNSWMFDIGYQGLCASARATIKVLERDGRP